MPGSRSASGRRPRLLDLFCCAGGASTGYEQAGFEVVGVDIVDQPRYPFEFFQADAMQVLAMGQVGPYVLEEFDAIAASPPCQASSHGRHMPGSHDHIDLIAPVREHLQRIGLPWVIENVVGAALITPILVCGSSFDLGADGHALHRHRIFESSEPMMALPCQHTGAPVMGIYGDRMKTSRGATLSIRSSRWSRPASLAVGGEAMGIDWMTWRELREAIPPAYTAYVGGYLMAAVDGGMAVAA